MIPYRKDELKLRTNLPDLDRERYRIRDVIEPTIGKLKQFRSIAACFEKLAVAFLAMIQSAIVQLCLRAVDAPDTAWLQP